jgi:arabinan endo-1,5-alpha-L-arabinosidase
MVVRTTMADNYNAIDPSVMVDADNRMWMAFGSFWSGIKLVELDPATGLRKPGAPLNALADAKQIEAPYIISHQGTYYLFVNWGLCCRGIRSTYEIRVGRSAHITGPYLDKNGVNMLTGGGSLFLGREGRFIGPGQTGILRDGSNEWVSYHYYDGSNFGLASLGIRKLEWDKDGWPVAGENAANLISSNKTNR